MEPIEKWIRKDIEFLIAREARRIRAA